MPDKKASDKPLTFEEVVSAERRVLRPKEDGARSTVPLSALCISGGGVRSATFAAGAIQGLAEKDILDQFDYLSTVSGGGYIGSWLTSWKQREGGIEKIIPSLRPNAPFPAEKEPDPVQHLREYNNYLSPRLSLFSADTWTLAATVARNMLLNWLVLVPLLMFVLMAPRLILSLAMYGEHLNVVHGENWIQHTKLGLEIGTLAALFFAISTVNALRYLPGVGRTNHKEGTFLVWCLLPLILSVLSFITMESWITGGDQNFPTTLTLRGLLLAIPGSGLAGWLVYLLGFRRKNSKKTELVGLAIVSSGLVTAYCVWQLVNRLFPAMGWETYVAFGPPLLLLAFSLPLILFVGWTSNVLEEEDREWLSRAGAWLLLFMLGWAGICSLVLIVPAWAFKLPAWGRSDFAGVGGVGGIVTALGGFSSRSKRQKSHEKENPGTKPTVKSALLPVLLQFSAAVFVVIFLIGLAILTNFLLSSAGWVPGNWTNHSQFVEATGTRYVVITALIFLLFAMGMAKVIDINKFSLHGMYRSRLIRAYLGASNRTENIHKFIGFANNDDIPMHGLKAESKPFHVVNVTLNLVSGKRLSWQQRKAVAFTVTPLHCGSSQLGYRPSDEYAKGISLGTAMTLSGAAASPNMGYYSSPVIGFIMTLFNARLGAWLGNPGEHGAATWKEQGPKSAVASIVREAFGLTTEDCPYVYLSDGGHFENLGLYEMVKRGCRYIMVLDGAADGELRFADLGNALRKIRIDTKIDIEFEGGWADRLRKSEKRCAVARICYKAAGKAKDDGWLIYVKPSMHGTEPPDVVSYHAANPDFPHQSTADQFFNESQTESYRMLGLHTMREILKGWVPSKGFQGLAEHLQSGSKKASGLASAAQAGA